MNQTATASTGKRKYERRTVQVEIRSTSWRYNHTERPCKVTIQPAARVKEGDQVIYYLEHDDGKPSFGIYEKTFGQHIYFKFLNGSRMAVECPLNQGRPNMYKIVNVEFMD